MVFDSVWSIWLVIKIQISSFKVTFNQILKEDLFMDTLFLNDVLFVYDYLINSLPSSFLDFFQSRQKSTYSY